MKVAVSENPTDEADCIRPSALNVPKRERATTTGHRSAAAYGANSAP